MNPVTTPPQKALRQISRRQQELEQKFAALAVMVREAMNDEVTPTYQKKLKQWSRELDNGGGYRFENVSALREYFRSLAP